jgi:leucyl aminopeptidase
MLQASKLLLAQSAARSATPIHVTDADGLDALSGSLSKAQRAWLKHNRFTAAPGKWLAVPDQAGGVAMVLYGKPAADADPFEAAALATALPAGNYALAGDVANPELQALGWLLACYRFNRYLPAKSNGGKPEDMARLVCPAGVGREQVIAVAEAVAMGRDLINTPAEDMGPSELEAAARALAKAHKARFAVTKGAGLQKNFPMIHAVGRASDDAPRLIDITWGRASAPKVTLVGKGVCFDTGGLDIKPSSGMALMKKDMGGAAAVLSLASMVMQARLDVRLRVLIPAVENAVSGNSFRPGDILTSRKGLTVEIGNTDAEGRLVLADALHLADMEKPDLLVDMATLTGAARVALGPDLPPFYTDDDALAGELASHATSVADPVWRMPFWGRYNEMFSSKVADINNAGTGGFAGSITAALFLKRFVEQARSYVHLDIYGWVPSARPARPLGGEPQAARALFSLLSSRYPARK